MHLEEPGMDPGRYDFWSGTFWRPFDIQHLWLAAYSKRAERGNRYMFYFNSRRNRFKNEAISHKKKSFTIKINKNLKYTTAQDVK